MEENEVRFSIEELAEAVGLSVRTIRYYIAEGLLPGPGARGKAATYGEEHVLRLRLIRLFSERHMPLAEMQQLLGQLSVDEVRALLEEEEQRARTLQQSAQQQTAREYVAGLLKNAQTARHESSRGSDSRQPGGQMPHVPLPIAPPAVPAPRPMPLPSVPAPPVRGYTSEEAWRRWELAPGVELHIRADAEQRQRHLIERLFQAIGLIFRPLHR